MARLERTRPRTFWLLLLALAVLAIELPVFCRWLSEPAPNGSLLEDGSLRARDVMGLPRQVLAGRLADDGSRASHDRSLVLGNRGGFLAIDVGEPVQARALLVQTRAASELDVEGSLDGESWQSLWSVPAEPAANGMRTRQRTFDPPASFRHLRVRNRGSEGVAVLGALRAYAEIPDGWPRLDPARRAPPAGFPWLSLAAVHRIKLAVALAGAFLLLAAWRLDRERARRATLARRVDWLLALSAGLAALGWWNFLQISSGDYERSFYNYWDLSHYYLGAKYAPELGYTNLYRCMLAADVEAGLGDARLENAWVHDLATNGWVRTRDVMQEPERCTRRFTADRWQAFQADQALLRTRIPPGRQLQILQDHGYNGTPVWGIAGSAIGALGSASDFGFAVALALDPILLVLSFACVWSTFGFRATCAALILFGTAAPVGNWFTAGAFLRFDWLFASVLGVCCLKRERWLLAGFALAWATSLRLIPGFLIGGVAVHALAQMLRERSWRPAAGPLRFATAAAVGLLALGALSIAVAGDAGIWRGFLDNSLKHKATTTASNVGLEASTALLHDTHRDGHVRFQRPAGRPGHAEAYIPVPLRWGIAAATLLLLGLAARREPAWVCAILGLCWLPFASDVTFYYYAGAILFSLLLERAPLLTLPYALLLVVWGCVGVAFDYVDTYLYGWSSAALVIYSLSALACFALRREPSRSDAAAA